MSHPESWDNFTTRRDLNTDAESEEGTGISRLWLGRGGTVKPHSGHSALTKSVANLLLGRQQWMHKYIIYII